MSRPFVTVCAVVALLVGACGEAAPPDDDPAAVEAPTELVVDGERLELSTYAWQDQMPTVGDEPGPCASLCVNGTIDVASGEPLPDDLEVVDVVALVEGDELRFEEHEIRGRLGPSNYEFVVRRGPPLEPGTTFDLAVLLEVEGEQRWIRAADVTVERTV